MARILFIIAQKGFRDEELLHPKEECEKAGITCHVASISTNQAVGKLGAIVKPNKAVKDVNVDDYDLCVVVGGPGSPELANHPEVLNLLNEFKARGKKLGAICYGPTVLAKAGLLKGKTITAFQDDFSIPILEGAGAKLTGDPVHGDSDLVTASGPEAARDFGKALVKWLKSS